MEDVMNALLDLLQLAVLITPFLVAAVTEALKRLPVFPAVNKYVKTTVFVLSVIAVGYLQSSSYVLESGWFVVTAGEVVVTYATAIGFYETVKKRINKI